MKFLCLGYFDQKKMDALSQTQVDAVMRECQPHLDELYRSGSVLVDAGLSLETKCLQRVTGKVITIDGPFTETKELLGGVFILEATDIEHAVQLAARHPTTRVSKGEELGWRLEIRPIDYFAQPAHGA